MRCGKLVNVVASGDFGRQLDTDALSDTLSEPVVQPGRLYFKLDEDGPTVMVFRGGSYTIAGADSIEEINETAEQLFQHFQSIGLAFEEELAGPVVQYMTVTFDLNFPLQLEILASEFGVESAEYEPEQFNALIYRPNQSDCVILAFPNGKITVTGAKSKEQATNAMQDFRENAREYS